MSVLVIDASDRQVFSCRLHGCWEPTCERRSAWGGELSALGLWLMEFDETCPACGAAGEWVTGERAA